MSSGTLFKIVTQLVDPSDSEIRDAYLEAKEKHLLKGFKKWLMTVCNQNENWHLNSEVGNLNWVSSYCLTFRKHIAICASYKS